MSELWNEGYFTDVGYTYGYYRELSPAFQRFCLLIRGYTPPEEGISTHCELGYGQGIAINIHAAVTQGTFYGTDFNPEHAAHALKIAEKAGNGAMLYDDSFEGLLERNLPQFDSISLHGIWTWVSRENHKVIVEFLKQKLKPGGIVYNSYNCFPGWSPSYPLRQVFALYDRFSTQKGGVAERIDGALKFAEGLIQSKPAYLSLVPTLESKLKTIMANDRHYLAHEYFNREWNCMYFSDVVDALAAAKVEFACSANPVDLIDEVNLLPEWTDFLRKIENRIMREQIRDYFVNQQFRKDLFLRGGVRLKAGEQMELLAKIRFVLVRLAKDIPMTVTGTLGEVSLKEDIYKPIIETLAEEAYAPKTIAQILGKNPTLDFGKVLQAVIVLTHYGYACPCQDESTISQVRNKCERLNAELCDRARHSGAITYLASPVVGGGVLVDRIYQLFITAIKKGIANAPEYAWINLSNAGEVILKDGKPLEGKEANLQELQAKFKKFSTEDSVILRSVGII